MEALRAARVYCCYRSLIPSPCREVNILARVVAKDIRSTTARNLRMLESETGLEDWPGQHQPRRSGRS